MQGREALLLLLLAVVVAVPAAGCAINPAPSGTLVTAEAMQRTAFGGYILVEHRNGAKTRGELLAVGDGQVHVQTAVGPRTLAIAEVYSMRLAAYQTDQAILTGWGLAGTLSTLTHGYLLVISGPVWLLATGFVAGIESRAALVDFPGEPLEHFRPWARYPQGMPVGPPAPPAPGPTP
jgi:hypothetical protein